LNELQFSRVQLKEVKSDKKLMEELAELMGWGRGLTRDDKLAELITKTLSANQERIVALLAQTLQDVFRKKFLTI